MNARAVARRARIAVRHATLHTWISSATPSAATWTAPSTRSFGWSAFTQQEARDASHDVGATEEHASGAPAEAAPPADPTEASVRDHQLGATGTAAEQPAAQDGSTVDAGTDAAQQTSTANVNAEDIFRVRAPASRVGAIGAPAARTQLRSSDLRMGVKMESSMLQARESTRPKQEKSRTDRPRVEQARGKRVGENAESSSSRTAAPGASEATTRIRAAIMARDWKAAEAAVVPEDAAARSQIGLLDTPELDVNLTPKDKATLLDLFSAAVDKREPCLDVLIVLTNHALRTCDTSATSADQLTRWVQLLLRLNPALDITNFTHQFGEMRKRGPPVGLDAHLAKMLVMCLFSSAVRAARAANDSQAQMLARRETEFVVSIAKGQARLRRSTLHMKVLVQLVGALSADWPHDTAVQQAARQARDLFPVLDAVWGLDGQEPASEASGRTDGHAVHSQTPQTDADDMEEQAGPVRNALARRFGALVETKSHLYIDNLGKGARQAIDLGFLTLATGDRGTSSADWNDTTSAIQIRSLLQLKRPEEAAMAWDAHLRASQAERPSALVWSGLLSGYSSMGNWEAMRSTWASMRPSERDSHSLTTTIAGLFRARLVDEALGLFDQYKKSNLCVIATYNAVLHGLATNAQMGAAELLFNDMLNGPAHLRPNQTSFNTLLRANARRQDLQSVSKTLEQMDAAGVVLDVVTFTTILDGLLRAGHPNATKDVMKIVKDSGVELNAHLVTALIRCTLFDQTPLTAQSEGLDVLGNRDEGANGPVPQAREALVMMLDMERNGPAPTGITYTAIMSGLGKMRLSDVSRAMVAFPQPFGRCLPRKLSQGESKEVLEEMRHVAPLSALMIRLRDHIIQRSFVPSRAQNHILLDALLLPKWTREALSNPALGQLINNTQQLFDSRCMHLLHAMVRRTNGLDVPSARTYLLVFRHLIDRLRSGDSSAAPRLNKVLELYGGGKSGKMEADAASSASASFATSTVETGNEKAALRKMVYLAREESNRHRKRTNAQAAKTAPDGQRGHGKGQNDEQARVGRGNDATGSEGADEGGDAPVQSVQGVRGIQTGSLTSEGSPVDKLDDESRAARDATSSTTL